jgi:hypothetical protein
MGFVNSTDFHSIQLLQFLQPYSAAAAKTTGAKGGLSRRAEWADQQSPNKLVLLLSAPP